MLRDQALGEHFARYALAGEERDFCCSSGFLVTLHIFC